MENKTSHLFWFLFLIIIVLQTIVMFTDENFFNYHQNTVNNQITVDNK